MDVPAALNPPGALFWRDPEEPTRAIAVGPFIVEDPRVGKIVGCLLGPDPDSDDTYEWLGSERWHYMVVKKPPVVDGDTIILTTTEATITIRPVSVEDADILPVNDWQGNAIFAAALTLRPWPMHDQPIPTPLSENGFVEDAPDDAMPIGWPWPKP